MISRRQLTLRMLHLFTIIGAVAYCAYAIFLISQEWIHDRDVLNCKSSEFVVQSSLLIIVVSFFLFSAIRTSKAIDSQIEASKGDH